MVVLDFIGFRAIFYFWLFTSGWLPSYAPVCCLKLFLHLLPPAVFFRRLGVALGGSRSGSRNGFRPIGLEGEEVLGGAVELHAG